MADTETPQVDLSDDPLKQPEGPHPFAQDLNPEFLKGENYGLQGPHPEKPAQTAYEVKGVHNRLRSWPDNDLKQIPIMPEGARLEQGATYIDLQVERPVEFVAEGNIMGGSDNWYVPKSEVPYWIWNKLIGIHQSERLDE